MFPVWNSYTQEMIGEERPLLNALFSSQLVPELIYFHHYTLPSTGDHCGVLIGDAYQKGLMSGQSAELAENAYGAMRKNALDVPSAEEYLAGKGRRAVKEYLTAGFVPLEATMPLTFHSREQVREEERVGGECIDGRSLLCRAD